VALPALDDRVEAAIGDETQVNEPGTSTLQVAQPVLPVGLKLNFWRPNFSAIRCPGSAGLW
jgi:hypothetical protein